MIIKRCKVIEFYCIHALLPLIAGLFIYYFSRAKLNFGLARLFNLYNGNKVIYNDFVTYNLNDGLWAYSLSSVIFSICPSQNNRYWLTICLILFCTIQEVFFGTFDPKDLITLYSAISFSYFYKYYLRKDISSLS